MLVGPLTKAIVRDAFKVMLKVNEFVLNMLLFFHLDFVINFLAMNFVVCFIDITAMLISTEL